MLVLLATSWDTRCGIADYAAHWKTAVEAADRSIYVAPSSVALDPDLALNLVHNLGYGWVWLNHHDALHSRWAPEHAVAVKEAGAHLGVTYHDTREGTADAPNSPKAKALCELADAFVVHEPTADLPGAILIRQGVHRGVGPWTYDRSSEGWLAYPQQPILGTVGFNQGWREFDQLARLTEEAGWGLVILSNNATVEDEARWRELNPALYCVREWLPTAQLVSLLAGCDATAFVHQCANTGTSGAIRLGLAARKPVVAVKSRQYRDLYLSQWGGGVHWCDRLEAVPDVLDRVPIGRVSTWIARAAERDSWRRQGLRYARLLRGEPEAGQ